MFASLTFSQGASTIFVLDTSTQRCFASQMLQPALSPDGNGGQEHQLTLTQGTTETSAFVTHVTQLTA